MLRLVAGIVIGVLLTIAALYVFDSSILERSQPLPEHESAAYDASDDVIEEVPNQIGKVIGNAPPARPSKTPSATSNEENRATAFPENISSVLKKGPSKKLHAQYEAQVRRERWAAYMEARVKSFLAQKAALHSFDISLIGCRSSICEIHAMGYGPDAYATWTAEISDIHDQSWFRFAGVTDSTRNMEPDAVAIVVILH